MKGNYIFQKKMSFYLVPLIFSALIKDSWVILPATVLSLAQVTHHTASGRLVYETVGRQVPS